MLASIETPRTTNIGSGTLAVPPVVVMRGFTEPPGPQRPVDVRGVRSYRRTDSQKLASLSLSLMLVALMEALHSLSAYLSDSLRQSYI